MIKNNKGFALTEVLIISTVIIGVLILMYAEFKNINRSYQYSFKYDTVEGMYLANNIINYINEESYDDLVQKLTEQEEKYIDITGCDPLLFNTSNYCETLFEKSKVEKILFVKEDLAELKENMESLNEDFKQYIKNIKTLNSINDYRIIIKYADGSFATMRFNKGNAYVTDGLIVHLDAINNTGNGHSNQTQLWKDISGNNNDATLYNNPLWSNNSIVFDGINDYGILTNTANLEFPNGLTVETRVNVLSLEGFEEYSYIMYIDNVEQNTTHGGFSQYILKSSINSVTRISDGSFHTLQSTTTSDLNKSYTVTTVYDNNNIKLYVNGTIAGISPLTSTYSKSSRPINIAKRANNEDYANVEFENIRIYNRALTQEEIMKNYQLDTIRY